jgi:hypothetical protein
VRALRHASSRLLQVPIGAVKWVMVVIGALLWIVVVPLVDLVREVVGRLRRGSSLPR